MKDSEKSFWFTDKGLVAICAIAFLGYFLFVEHRHHLAEWLPYIIILLCPLMHIFMHGGHDHSNHDQGHQHNNDTEEAYRRGLEEGRKENQNRSDTGE